MSQDGTTPGDEPEDAHTGAVVPRSVRVTGFVTGWVLIAAGGAHMAAYPPSTGGPWSWERPTAMAAVFVGVALAAWARPGRGGAPRSDD